MNNLPVFCNYCGGRGTTVPPGQAGPPCPFCQGRKVIGFIPAQQFVTSVLEVMNTGGQQAYKPFDPHAPGSGEPL